MQGKRGKKTLAKAKPTVAPLDNAKSTYDNEIEEITRKIVASFTCDEHGGKLCATLKGMREHVTYTMEDVAEHAKLLVS